MAKKSLVYLLCFLQPEYFNFCEFANAVAITAAANSTKLCFLQPEFAAFTAANSTKEVSNDQVYVVGEFIF